MKKAGEWEEDPTKQIKAAPPDKNSQTYSKEEEVHQCSSET